VLPANSCTKEKEEEEKANDTIPVPDRKCEGSRVFNNPAFSDMMAMAWVSERLLSPCWIYNPKSLWWMWCC